MNKNRSRRQANPLPARSAIPQSYAAANRLLGDIVKVTPSSKVCGDLALFMVQNGLSEDDVKAQARTLNFPGDVVRYFQGYLGIPYGGFPEELRKAVVGDREMITGRPGAAMAPVDLARLQQSMEESFGDWITEEDALSAALYPDVFNDFAAFYNEYGDISVLPTPLFLSSMEVGKECVCGRLGRVHPVDAACVMPVPLRPCAPPPPVPCGSQCFRP